MMRCDFDVIFIDCNMPHLDGYQATMQIREYLYYKGLTQPIISAITGSTEQIYIDKAINAGMNQVLSKPTSIKIIRDLMIKMKYVEDKPA